MTIMTIMTTKPLLVHLVHLVALVAAISLLPVACGSNPAHAVVTVQHAISACGVAGQGRVLLTNEGDDGLEWTGTLVDIPGAELSPSRGSLRPHEALVIQIRTPVQAPGAPFVGMLTIASNDSLHPKLEVPIQVRRSGARLAVDKDVLDFGIMPLGAATPVQTFTVKNEGNDVAALSSDPPEGFSVAFGKTTIPPGESATASISFDPTRLGFFTQVLTVRLDNPCGELPTIKLKGIGSDGVVGITPGVADFGLVGCGTIPQGSVKVSVFNVSKQPFQVSSSVTGSSLFQVSPAQTTVNAESSVDVDVTMPLVPAEAPLLKDYFTGTLHLVTTAPKDTAHDLPIVASPAGGILVLDGQPDLDFAKRDALSSMSTKSFGVKNFGNVTVTVGGTVAAPFSIVPTSPLAPGNGGTVGVVHMPRFVDVGTDRDEAITLTTSDPICAPMPGAVRGKAHTFEKPLAAAKPIEQHTCAIGQSGHVYCWGLNGKGQLGDGTTTNRPTPTLVSSLTDAIGVSTSYEISCAVTSKGEVWCWGDSTDGQIPSGDSLTPAQVMGINDAVSVVVTRKHGCARRKTGGVWCWGSSGNLGAGNLNGPTSPPVAVSNLSDAVDLDARWQLTCAVRQTTKDVVCWGDDYPNNYVFAQTTPVVISGSDNAREVETTGNGACFLQNIPNMSCWGLQNDGTWDPTLRQTLAPVTSGFTAAGNYRCGLYSGIECFGYDKMLDPLGVRITIKSGTAAWVGSECALGIDGGALLQWGTWMGVKMSPTAVFGFDP